MNVARIIPVEYSPVTIRTPEHGDRELRDVDTRERDVERAPDRRAPARSSSPSARDVTAAKSTGRPIPSTAAAAE